MRTLATTAGMAILLWTASAPAAAQCQLANDPRHGTRLRLQLVGAGEVAGLRLELSRLGADKVEFPVRQEEDGSWTVQPSWTGFRICEIDLRLVVPGYDVEGPTSCTYDNLDARYTFSVSPVLLMDLEVEPYDAAFRLREQPFGRRQYDSKCLPDRPEWRRLSGGGDRELTARARDALLDHPDLASFAIEVSAHDGVVYLAGSIGDGRKAEAARVANVAGADRVDTDQLRESLGLAGLAHLPDGEEKVELRLQGAAYSLKIDPALRGGQLWEPSIDTLAKELFSADIPYSTRNRGQAVNFKRSLLTGIDLVRFRKR